MPAVLAVACDLTITKTLFSPLSTAGFQASRFPSHSDRVGAGSPVPLLLFAAVSVMKLTVYFAWVVLFLAFLNSSTRNTYKSLSRCNVFVSLVHTWGRNL